MIDVITAREICKRFAQKHKIVFEDHGEVGFGRACVGFLHGSSYVDINPIRMDGQSFSEVWGWARDERLNAPLGVNAYSKHSCLAVIVENEDYNTAIEQLSVWVTHLESQGTLELAPYLTGAKGLQVLFSGAVGYAFRFAEAK
jgi:hypothetical protein